MPLQSWYCLQKKSDYSPGCIEIVEAILEAELPLLFFPPEAVGILVTWNTLALKPKAASIEIVSQDGEVFWGTLASALTEAAEAAKSGLLVLLRIFAGGISFCKGTK